MSTKQQTEDRRSGRPRSARADDAIRQATIEGLLADGYGGLSIERVAAAAGVGKTTIYRRFAGKAELVADALAARVGPPPMPDTGRFRGDVREAFRQGFSDERVALGTVLLPRILGDASRSPELAEIVDRTFLGPRREAALAAIRRGVERGELRPDLDLESAVDLLVGAIVYRLLYSGGDISLLDTLPERHLAAALAGLSAPGARQEPVG